MLCVKCQKRPAVVFVQRLENGKAIQEGYCLTCARAMHIQPVDDLMKQFGMSDQDLESMEERMSSFLQEAADSGMMAPMMGGDMTDGGDENTRRTILSPAAARFFPSALVRASRKLTTPRAKTARRTRLPAASSWIPTART